jgi:hypothetical protein
LRIAEVFSSSAPSSGGSDSEPWPVAWGATRSPFCAANRTTASTSSAVAGSTTAAGFWSTARFHERRAAFQPGSPGNVTRSRSLLGSSVRIVMPLWCGIAAGVAVRRSPTDSFAVVSSHRVRHGVAHRRRTALPGIRGARLQLKEIGAGVSRSHTVRQCARWAGRA